MIYKGRIAIVGGADDPLPVNCEVTDNRLMITTGDGSVIGDWGVREIGTERTSDGVVLHVEGEDLLVSVRDADAFAEALRVGEGSDVATRISVARASKDQDRLRPFLAVGVAAALLAVAGIVLWATGTPPFERADSESAALVVTVTTTVPPSTTTTAYSMSDEDLFLTGLRLTVEPNYPTVANVPDSVLLNAGYGMCEVAATGRLSDLDPALSLSAAMIGVLETFDDQEQGMFVLGATLVSAGESICKENKRYIAAMLDLPEAP